MNLYRAEVINYGQDGLHEFEIYFRQFEVIRETEHYYVILHYNKERRVKKNAKKYFANVSKEKAVTDAYNRNLRERAILKARVEYSKEVGEFLKNIVS